MYHLVDYQYEEHETMCIYTFQTSVLEKAWLLYITWEQFNFYSDYCMYKNEGVKKDKTHTATHSIPLEVT